MVAGIYQSAVILAVVAGFYSVDFLLISRYDKQRQAEGSGRSWGYTILVLSLVVLMIVQPTVWPWLSVHVDGWWGAIIQVIGVGLTLCALATQTWARVHLRQFYAERVEVQPGHVVVDTGPYAYVRHPFFTALFMFAIGLVLINPSLPTLVVAVYTFWDFSRAAKQEEVLLSETLPGYEEYMMRTPRFLPRFRSRLGDR